MAAIINRKFEVMQMLLEGGANINAVAKVRNLPSWSTFYTVLHIKTMSCTILCIFLFNSSSPQFSSTLHYTILHCTTLDYPTSHYTTLQYTALHYTTLHHTTLHSTHTPPYSKCHVFAICLTQLYTHTERLHCPSVRGNKLFCERS